MKFRYNENEDEDILNKEKVSYLLYSINNELLKALVNIYAQNDENVDAGHSRQNM